MCTSIYQRLTHTWHESCFTLTKSAGGTGFVRKARQQLLELDIRQPQCVAESTREGISRERITRFWRGWRSAPDLCIGAAARLLGLFAAVGRAAIISRRQLRLPRCRPTCPMALVTPLVVTVIPRPRTSSCFRSRSLAAVNRQSLPVRCALRQHGRSTGRPLDSLDSGIYGSPVRVRRLEFPVIHSRRVCLKFLGAGR